MKKTLIALAAIAVSGAAFAQSNVTLYGVADLSIADNNAPATKIAASANGVLNNGNSRFGLRGSEDLGGGLKANFNIEAAVNLANGATDANMFQRAAYVELAGGFGSVRAGRSLSPQFYAIATYELTGTANYSAVANTFGFGGGSRNDAMIAYSTPNMGGFGATLGTKLAGNNAGNAKTDLNVRYVAGPLAAALGYDKTSGGVASTSIGASYNLGMAKVAVGFYDPAVLAKGFSVGVSAPVGPVSLTLDIAKQTELAKNTNYLLEAKYPLSKRTFAYGAFLRTAGVNTYGVGVRHNF